MKTNEIVLNNLLNLIQQIVTSLKETAEQSPDHTIMPIRSRFPVRYHCPAVIEVRT